MPTFCPVCGVDLYCVGCIKDLVRVHVIPTIFDHAASILDNEADQDQYGGSELQGLLYTLADSIREMKKDQEQWMTIL